MDKYLKRVLSYNHIVIYGAGIVGKKVLNELKEHGAFNKVECFVVSEVPKKETYIDNIPVKGIGEIETGRKNIIFLLAVSEKYIVELKKEVKKLGIRHYMDARKLYLDSYKKNDISLLMLKIRDKLYVWFEGGGGTRHRVTHVTYCRIQNAGDTMLSHCVRRFLSFRNWNIKAVTSKVNNSMITEINKSKMLIVGGGGLFLPDTNANEISGWQWGISKEQIDSIQIPIVVFSVGYNYFKGQTNSEIFVDSVKHLVEKSAFVGLRNMGSVRAIRNILDNDSKDKIIYQPCTTVLISKIWDIHKRKNTKLVGINVAFDREDRRYGKNKNVILSQIAKAAKEIEKKGYHIRYVAHCNEDLEFLKWLDIEKVSYAAINLTDCLPGKIVACYEDLDLVLGMRGHAQMIPFGVGCRIISLGAHDKMKWFLEDINALDWYIDLNCDVECISGNVIQKFNEVNIVNKEETDQRIEEEKKKLWKISCDNRDKILKLM